MRVTLRRGAARFAPPFALAIASIVGCHGEPPPKRPPLGLLPSATTTAQPEWIPFGVRVGEIRDVDPRETALRDMRRIPTEGDATFVAWSPNGRKLLYEEVLDKASRIVVVDLETLKVRPLPVGNKEARRARFAPGTPETVTLLLRAEGTTSAFSLVGSALDGSGLSVLAGPDHNPVDAVSIGKTILFVGTEGGERAIFSAERGAPPAVAVNAPGDEDELTVAPDATSVVWTQRKGGRTALVAASFPEMTRHQRALTPDDILAGQASFLGDSRRLVFSSTRDAAAREVYVTSLEGPAGEGGMPVARRITFAPHGSEAPAVSPDGVFLAFVSAREASGGKKDVYVARWSMPE